MTTVPWLYYHSTDTADTAVHFTMTLLLKKAGVCNKLTGAAVHLIAQGIIVDANLGT